jgi:hypothetical protein
VTGSGVRFGRSFRYRLFTTCRDAGVKVCVKTKNALFGALLLIVASCLPVLGQAPSATISLTVEPSVVMAEKPLTLEAILTNRSDKQMFFELALSCGFDATLDIKVRDDKGNQPSQTILLRRATHQDVGPDGRALNPEHDGHTHICMGSFAVRGVMPNDTLKTTVDLSQMYDLSQPGKYTVQVRRVDTNNNAWQSNSVEFTVVPNPNYTPEIPCTVSAEVTVIVNDPSGAVVPEAAVVLRPEGNAKERQVTTGSAGVARAQGVPCGFVDVFVAGDGLTPYARKMYIGKPVVPLTVVLYPWPQRSPSEGK